MDQQLLISFSNFLHFTWLWRLMYYRNAFRLQEQMMYMWVIVTPQYGPALIIIQCSSLRRKTALIIDIEIPLTYNFTIAAAEKIMKYEN